MYPSAGYGGRFGSWLFSENREPYYSWGNGSDMRTAAAIFLSRTGHGKAEIRNYVERESGYDLSHTLDKIRPGYRFNES